MDAHDEARALIDRSWVEGISAGDWRRLAEHLDGCAPCRRSMELSARAVRGLGELRVETEAGLDLRVRAALARRARELERERARRRKALMSCVVALPMTAAGSMAAWSFAGWLAASRHLAPRMLEAAVVVFWLLPSLCAALLLLVPHLIAAPAERKGGSV